MMIGTKKISLDCLRRTVKAVQEGQWKRMREFLCIVLIVFIVFICNWQVRMTSVAFLDDVLAWKALRSEGFRALFFGVKEFGKFRPVSQLAMLLVLRLSRYIPEAVGLAILAIHSIIAVLIYKMANKLSGNQAVGFGIAIVYQISRLAYYQVNQVLGIMEATGLIFSIGMLYYLIVYIKEHRCFCSAIVLYILATFSHERYMFLFPVLFIAVIFAANNQSTRRIHLCITVATVVLAYAIRYVYLGNSMWAGTGGDRNVIESFNVGQAFRFAIDQACFLLGFNAGPAYLAGISASEVSNRFTCLICILDVFLFAYAIISLCVGGRKGIKNKLKLTALCLLFIAMCIGSSSVTIRVEMRWIYTSFVALLLLIAAMWGEVALQSFKPNKIVFAALAFCLCGYFVMECYIETSYRKSWPRIYYWSTKESVESLEDVTWRKYGESLLRDDCRIVFVESNQKEWENELEMMKNSLAVRANEEAVEKANIDYVRNIREIHDADTENVIYLARKNDKYIDISELIELYVNNVEVDLTGIYDDRWILQNAEMEIYAGDQGICRLQFYTNQEVDETWAKRTGRVYVNEEVAAEYVMDTQLLYLDLELPPNKKALVRFENDWTDPNVTRNGEGMCFTMTVLENR